MADWPLNGAPFVLPQGITAVSSGVSVTSGAANVKTATAVQLCAATPFEAQGVYVEIRTKGSAGDFLLDILSGAAGSEQVLIPDIYFGGATNTAGVYHYFFPINITQGTRLSLKTQCSSATAAATVIVNLVGMSFVTVPACERVAALGIVRATTRGAALTAPGTADTYPAWTEIGYAPFDIKYLIPVLGQQAIAARTTAQRFVAQWAQGAAGSEQVLLDGTPFATTSTTSFNGHFGMPYPVDIKSGTRLAGRYASSALTTLGADGILYAVG